MDPTPPPPDANGRRPISSAKKEFVPNISSGRLNSFCRKCDGRGYLPTPEGGALWRRGWQAIVCPICGGRGTL